MSERQVLRGMDRAGLDRLAWTAIGYSEDETQHLSDDDLAEFIVASVTTPKR